MKYYYKFLIIALGLLGIAMSASYFGKETYLHNNTSGYSNFPIALPQNNTEPEMLQQPQGSPMLFGTTPAAGVQNNPDAGGTTVYPSSNAQSVISSNGEPGQNTSFPIDIAQQLKGGEDITLEYELFGVKDCQSISRSINDGLSTGGYMVKSDSTGWHKQSEKINPKQLKQGRNEIRFTLPQGSDYRYSVRNLKLNIASAKDANQRELVVNQPDTRYYYKTYGYVQGFVKGKDSEKAKITVNGKTARCFQNTFEALANKIESGKLKVENDPFNYSMTQPFNPSITQSLNDSTLQPFNSSWSATVTATFPDGETLTAEVTFDKPMEWDYLNGFDPQVHYAEQFAVKGKSFDMGLPGARLQGDTGTLKQDVRLSVTALRDVDMAPVTGGIYNVTGKHSGYRFLPHGTHFTKPVTVAMAYDPKKLPQGYTPKDIRTLYYDENQHQWTALPVDTIDEQNHIVYSITDHFTDFINGIVQVPEHPEAQAYTPTTMKGIEAANPMTGISSIQPPTANSQGIVNLNYPIEIPAGRQGMQPQLQIQYNSENQGSWLGIGWDLNIPSISVDTRWGVPRYDSRSETETYTFNGEELTPAAHRENMSPRITNKQFYPRTEGEFAKIIRKGSATNTYCWEVTDKQGSKYYYGSYDGSNLNSNAVLATTSGNIAYWALCEIKDVHNNSVRYHYSIRQHYNSYINVDGTPSQKYAGKQLWLDSITYTNYHTKQGIYKVVFYDRCYCCRRSTSPHSANVNNPGQPGTGENILTPLPTESSCCCGGGVDRRINARYGLRKSNRDKLAEIAVLYKDQIVRKYQLCYGKDPFGKPLLKSVTCYDDNDPNTCQIKNVLHTHQFEYYADIVSNGVFVPFKNVETWTSQAAPNPVQLELTSSAGVNKAMQVLMGSARPEEKSTGLGSSQSLSAGFSITGSLGLGPNIISRFVSAGYSYNQTHSWNQGRLMLIDMNGDGLPDKVYQSNGKTYIRFQKVESNGTHSFGAEMQFFGVPNFLKEKSTTHTHGPDCSFGLYGGYRWGSTTSTTSTFLADINGDGFPDLVSDGSIYYNTAKVLPPSITIPQDNCSIPIVSINENAPQFSCSSDSTAVPIDETENIILDETQDSTFEFTLPEHDVVRVWESKMDGYYQFFAPVQLIQDSLSKEPFCGEEDGIVVSVQHENHLVWLDTIWAGDYNIHSEWTGWTYYGNYNQSTIENNSSVSSNGESTSTELTTQSSNESLASVRLTWQGWVLKGKRLYFRVRPIKNGVRNKIRWNMQTNNVYTPYGLNFPDANRLGIANDNDQMKSFLLSEKAPFICPYKGIIKMSYVINKPATTDSVRFEVLKNGVLVSTYNASCSGALAGLNPLSIPVNENDTLKFKMSSSTNVDWNDIKWRPRLEYTAITDPNDPDIPVYDDAPQNTKPNFVFYPVPEHTFYNDMLLNHIPTPRGINEVINSCGLLQPINYSQIYVAPIVTFSTPCTGSLTFTVKKRGALLYKRVYTIQNNNIVYSRLNEKSLSVSPTDTLFFEFHTSNRQLALKITECKVYLRNGVTTSMRNALLYTVGESNPIFGPMYQGWGQFLYKRDGRAVMDTNKIRFNSSMYDPNSINQTAFDTTNMKSREVEVATGNNRYNAIMQAPSLPMFADGTTWRWRGLFERTWVYYDTISLIKPCIQFPDDPFTVCDESGSGSGSGTKAGGQSGSGRAGSAKKRGISKISKTKTNGWTLGLSLLLGGVGKSGTEGTTKLVSDMIDLNGDGFPDLIQNGKVQYSLPTGGLESTSKMIFSPNHYLSFFSGTGKSASADFIGIVASLSNKSKGSPVLSTSGISTGTESSSVDGGVDYSLIDINGDGLPDKVFKGGRYQLNLGYGFDAQEDYMPLEVTKNQSKVFGNSLSVSAPNNVNLTELRNDIQNAFNGVKKSFKKWDKSLSGGVNTNVSDNSVNYTYMDVNGDGMADLVQSINPLKVRFNTGSGFSPVVYTWNPDGVISTSSNYGQTASLAGTLGVTFFGLVKITGTLQAFAGKSFTKEYAQLMDIDGDGYLDYVISSNENQLKVRRSNMGRTNLLKTVKCPGNAQIDIAYRLTDPTPSYSRRWVMDSVQVYDGYNGNGADKMLQTFKYEAGYYDRKERTFNGFAKVTINDHNTQNGNQIYRTWARTYLNNSHYTKNLVVSDLFKDGNGNYYTLTTNTYQLKDSLCIADRPNPYMQNGTGSAYPALIKTKTCFYEGTPQGQKSTTKTFEYGKYGNINKYIDWGDVNAGDIPVQSDINYYINTAKYIVGIPNNVKVSSNGTTYRQRICTPDPNTGKILELTQYLNTSGTKNAKYNMKYDNYGNLETITYPVDDNNERVSYTYSYDAEVNTYCTLVTNNAFGYTYKTIYDYRFGKPLETKDINNQPVQYEYDMFGRLSKVTSPYELASGAPYTLKFEYKHLNNPPYAVTDHIDPKNPGGSPLVRTAMFTDGLGRVIQTQKTAMVYGNPSIVVSGWIWFDAFGRTVSQRYPATLNPSFFGGMVAIISSEQPTVYQYDVMDRLTKTTFPDNTTIANVYGFNQYQNGVVQHWIRNTDPNGHSTEGYANVRGQQLYVQDALGGWLKRIYNPLGEQIEVIDPENNSSKFSYDMLGRTTQIGRNNSMGNTYLNTDFYYDNANNLRSKITTGSGSSEKIIYLYDKSRLSGVDYGSANKKVSYIYGSPGEAYNRAGRVVYQKDESGVQEFEYGPMGEVTANIRTFDIPFGEPLAFATRWNYDVWNRTTAIEYPDGEKVNYDYDTHGQLYSISGNKAGHGYKYLSYAHYDKFGNRAIMKFGNGTQTDYVYNPVNLRLNMSTVSNPNRNILSQNQYNYDNTGNITDITRNGDNGVNSHRSWYGYDELNRLIKAGGSSGTKSRKDDYTLNMVYSPAGRIEIKDQMHYELNIPVNTEATNYLLSYSYNNNENPFTPRKIDEWNYSRNDNSTVECEWDFKGNLRAQANLNVKKFMAFDEENRMSAYSEDHKRGTAYLYGTDLERTLKMNVTVNSVYINSYQWYNVSQIDNYVLYASPYMVSKCNGEYTKHYYMEGQRIAGKLGSGSQNPSPLKLSQCKYPDGWDKFHQTDDPTMENLEKVKIPKEVDKLPFTPFEKIWEGKGIYSGNPGDYEKNIYFYHADHLGSTGYVTDPNAHIAQHVEYLPWGEVMLEERKGNNYTNYLFNSKELDEESGFYYYSARYFDPKYITGFLSRDPLEDKYPGISPYAYCANNPIIYVDPDGRKVLNWNTRLSDNNSKVINGFANSNAKKEFNNVFNFLFNRSRIFYSVYNQLAKSEETTYSVYQKATWSTRALASYSSSTKKLQFYSSYIGTGEVFEEFFHAGQNEYYGDKNYSKRGTLAIEFEARVAKIYAAKETLNFELITGDCVLKYMSLPDMTLIVKSLNGEQVDTKALNNAFIKLRDHVIYQYDLDKKSSIDFNKSLKYFKTLIE